MEAGVQQFRRGRFKRVLDYIKTHPQEHDQSHWLCKTTGCFAGNAYRLAHTKRGEKTLSFVGALKVLGLSPQERHDLFTSDVLGDGYGHTLRTKAKQWLGLNEAQAVWVFSADRTVRHLELFYEYNGDIIATEDSIILNEGLAGAALRYATRWGFHR